MKIICLEENTGSGAVPRNIGLENSCGKYVFFMDADDLIIDTALENFYNFAEEYQSEIVYTDRGFLCGEEVIPQNLTEAFWNPPNFAVQVPIIETTELAERMQKFVKLSFGMTPWTKFLRRDFFNQ